MTLKERIESYFSQDIDKIDRRSALQTFNEFKFFLNVGDVRAAEPSLSDGNHGGWLVNDWVKKGILLGFRLGSLSEVSIDEHFRYFDKNTYLIYYPMPQIYQNQPLFLKHSLLLHYLLLLLLFQ